MDWQLISHYILGIVTLPISIYTVKSVVDNVGTLFDEDLTIKDRNLLKAVRLLRVLLPMVVLFHEIGHAHNGSLFRRNHEQPFTGACSGAKLS
jgi:hypothetical protein